jgi:DNA-binding XRE family transcriptional regulator
MLLDLEEIKIKMADRKPSTVAHAAGITRQALWGILSGKYQPSYDVLKKLTEYFSK